MLSKRYKSTEVDSRTHFIPIDKKHDAQLFYEWWHMCLLASI